MPLADRVVVMERLANLEKKLLFESADLMPATEPWQGQKRAHGFVSIIKYEMTPSEITAVAEGWHDATQAILTIMPQIEKEIAYNVIVNNGPGAGLYFEFLPYTQETGGFEHLGLWVCQGNPDHVASHLREVLGRTVAK